MFLFSDDPLFTDEELFLMCAASGGKTVQDTATGNPLTFVTDLARPLKSLLIPFTPQQEGSGNPSPENIRSIIPWNGLTVFGGGMNLCSGGWVDGGISGSTGAEDADTARMRSEYFPIKGGVNYYVVSNDRYKRIFFYDKEKTFISADSSSKQIKQAPDNAYFARAVIIKEETQPSEFSFNYPSTETALAPYRPITETDIVFPSPVYGGTLDVVSGVLTVEWIAHIFDGTETFLKNGTFTGGVRFLSSTMTGLMQTTAYCDKMYALAGSITTITNLAVKIGAPPYQVEMYVPDNSIVEGEATKDDFTRWLSENNVTVVARLLVPQEITLTPAQITALKGDNTIWSDADGQMTAVYLKKG